MIRAKCIRAFLEVMDPHGHQPQHPNRAPQGGLGAFFRQANAPGARAAAPKPPQDPPHDPPQTAPGAPQSPTPANDAELQLQLRLYARIEGATVLLQSFVDAGRVILHEREQAHLATLTEAEARATAPTAPTPPAPEPAPDDDKAVKPHRPYRPRVNATPMLVLSFRAAQMLYGAAGVCHDLGRELISRGVDLEAAVCKSRVSDYVLQFLHECGVDISDLPRNDAATLKRALDRIDEAIAAGVKWLNTLPGNAELTRRRMAEQRAHGQRAP